MYKSLSKHYKTRIKSVLPVNLPSIVPLRSEVRGTHVNKITKEYYQRYSIHHPSFVYYVGHCF